LPEKEVKEGNASLALIEIINQQQQMQRNEEDPVLGSRTKGDSGVGAGRLDAGGGGDVGAGSDVGSRFSAVGAGALGLGEADAGGGWGDNDNKLGVWVGDYSGQRLFQNISSRSTV
jgi:hypothetical protein